MCMSGFFKAEEREESNRQGPCQASERSMKLCNLVNLT
jgi:hypothetical protein